jgi:ribosome-binding factor A
MQSKRVARLNSLLKEVISEVIHKDVRNPHVHHLISVTRVDIAKDLQHAKVFISIISAKEEEKTATIDALNTASGFIAVHASKKVVMRYFPHLHFYLDNTVDKQMRIDGLLSKIQQERSSRHPQDDKMDEESDEENDEPNSTTT